MCRFKLLLIANTLKHVIQAFFTTGTTEAWLCDLRNVLMCRFKLLLIANILKHVIKNFLLRGHQIRQQGLGHVVYEAFWCVDLNYFCLQIP